MSSDKCPVCGAAKVWEGVLSGWEWECGREQGGGPFVACPTAENELILLRALCERLRIDVGDDATEGSEKAVKVWKGMNVSDDVIELELRRASFEAKAAKGRG